MIKNIRWKLVITGVMSLLSVLTVILYARADKDLLMYSGNFCVGVDLAAMMGITMLTIIFSLDGREPDRSSGLFYQMLIVDFTAVFVYILGWIVDGDPKLILFNYVSNGVNFLCAPLICYAFWNYQAFLYPEETGSDKKLTVVIRYFMYLDILYIIGSIAAGNVFAIDKDGWYQIRPGIGGTYIFPFFVLVTCMVVNLKRTIPIRKRISLIVFCVTLILTVIASVFSNGYTFTYAAVFLVLMLMYGMIQMERSIEQAETARENAEQKQILAEQSRDLAEKKGQMMLSQIKPHFIYNTLSVIYQLCKTDTTLARQTIRNFTTYLRTNMESLESNLPIPFEKELNHVKTYLSIEKQRFQDILQVKYEITCVDFSLPALTLQPLVENAVKYGVRSRSGGGTVTITTRKDDHFIYVFVEDDGMGFDMEHIYEDGRTHIGIENVRKRLELICGGELILESRRGIGTKATIILQNKTGAGDRNTIKERQDESITG